MWLRLFVALGLCYAFQGSAIEKPSGGCAETLVYVTDTPGDLQRTIVSREHLYPPNLREEWRQAKAEFTVTGDGEEVLTIKGLEVMRGFEKPYMAAIARTAATHGGKVLNVGFGIGFIDCEIEQLRAEFPITEHHIIELNAQVAERARKWREIQPSRDQIFIHEGDWREVLQSLIAAGTVFDAIAYDAFPLEKQDLHRDFVPFLEEALRLRAVKENTGILTFYMDSANGFGSRFEEFAKTLGVGEMSAEKVTVELPPCGNQYWERNFFFTPKLGRIHYRR